MIRKSDIVREAVDRQDWKKALQIAKDFRIGITQEQRSKMARAYECIMHPDFYRQIGINIPEAIEQGKKIVSEYSGKERKNSMKWDVKHDRAKRVIDAFLNAAGYWQEREDLTEGLSEEEKTLVNAEVELMISSIRKRYKLDVRLPEQKPQIQSKDEEMEIPTEKIEETLPEPIKEEERNEKPKRTRKKTTEKKASERKPRGKKEVENV